MELHIHFPAVIAAALLGFVIGGLWYSPMMFAGIWAREAGVDEERLRQGNMPKIFGLALACNLVAALNLAAFIGDKGGIAFGAFAGLATGLGWVSMALGVIYLFERRSLRLWLINGGYQVLVFTAMGALIGAWR